MTAASKRSFGGRVLRAGIAVGIAHLLFKLAGVVQAWAMSRYLPPGDYDAIYALAFENGIFMLFLIGEEGIAPAFLPVFLHERGDTPDGERRAWSFANAFLTLQALVLVSVVVFLVLRPDAFVRLVSFWSPDKCAEHFSRAVYAIRHLAPALLGLSLGSTTYVLLNGYKRFFLAAFGDAVWKFTVVAALLCFAFRANDAGAVLIWGLVAGSVLKLATHLVGLRDKLHFLRPSFAWNTPAMKSLLWLSLPLLAGILFAKVRDVVNNVYVLSALNADGLMQANSLGRKLQDLLRWIIPYTLSIAIFPFFCEMVDHDDKKALGDFITRSGRQLIAVFLPFAAVVAVLARPLTSFLFSGGHFDALAVQRTSVSMACYTFALPAAAIEAILMQAFFANRRMLSVSIVGIVFSAFSIVVSLLGLRFSQGNGLLFLGIVAGGFSLSRWLKSTTLVLLLRRNAPVFDFRQTISFLAKVLLASLLTAFLARYALVGVNHLLLPLCLPQRLVDLLGIAMPGALAVGVLFGLFMLMRVREPFELLELAKKAMVSRTPRKDSTEKEM